MGRRKAKAKADTKATATKVEDDTPVDPAVKKCRTATATFDTSRDRIGGVETGATEHDLRTEEHALEDWLWAHEKHPRCGAVLQHLR